jgi:cytochrome b561
MAMKDDGVRFGAISIINHWAVATLIIVMIAIGLYMGELPRGAAKGEWVDLHKSIGIIVLFLGAWRVLWRLIHRFPDDIARMPPWQQFVAKAVHILLLFAILAMPISGYMLSSMGGHPVSFFGLFDMPVLPQDKTIARAASQVHGVVAYMLIGLIALHVFGALKHHAVDKDATLRRMLGRPA